MKSTWITRALACVGIGFLATACAATAGSPAHAQSRNNIPVIVMPEDSDPRTVRRSSDINKRVMAELKQSMMNHGFRMLDEEMLAVQLGWEIRDRRPKTELVRAAKLANREATANTRSRALALYRIHAYKEDLGFANEIKVRIDGEIYDLQTNEFIGTYEIPLQSYSAPAKCNSACISEEVGSHAREIATSIGEVLGRKLAYLSPAGGGGTSSTVTSGGSGDPRCRNMTTAYTLRFKRFTNEEVNELLSVMTNTGSMSAAQEFPCFVRYDLLNKQAAVQSYEYVSTATTAKLDQWISIILSDMGLHPDSDVVLRVGGASIDMEKVISRRQPQQVPDGAKFN
jgi:hypothetical protein